MLVFAAILSHVFACRATVYVHVSLMYASALLIWPLMEGNWVVA